MTPSYHEQNDPARWERLDVLEKEPGRNVTARVLMMVGSDEMHRMGGVIVETWAHVVPRTSRSGSKYRAWCAQFSEAERKALGTYHNKFYHWEMRAGYPQEVGMTVSTLKLLRRAADFFATI